MFLSVLSVFECFECFEWFVLSVCSFEWFFSVEWLVVRLVG